MRRPCLTCGTLTMTSYCPRHTPAYKRMNPKRGSGGKAATFRRRTLAQTGGRCAVPGCRTPYDRVQAHHVHALGDGGEPDDVGVPLCFTHHARATRYAARARQRKPRTARTGGG